MSNYKVPHYSWTPEMDAVMKELYGTCSAKKVAEIINAKFGTGYTQCSIWNRAQTLKITSRDTGYRYSKEEDEWIRENIKKYTFPDLAKEYNKRFNRNVHWYAMRDRAQLLGLKSGSPIAKGYRSGTFLPIGSERIDTEGRVMIKVSDIPTTRQTKDHNLNWRFKSRWVWEQHYGQIPAGHSIIHLDGDSTNCDISNLECAPLSVQGYVAAGKINQATPQLKKCAIKMKTLEKILEGVAAKNGT